MSGGNTSEAASAITTLTHARSHLRDLAYQARWQGPVTLTDNGKPVAALVPVETLDELRRLRMQALAREGEQALVRGEFVAHTEAMRLLGRDEAGRPAA